MRRCWTLRAATTVALLSALSGTALAAANPGQAPPAAPDSTNAAADLGDAPLVAPNLGRPIFLGLIAAVFLVLGATVGANDHPDVRAQHRH
jgi:hypothetical protein